MIATFLIFVSIESFKRPLIFLTLTVDTIEEYNLI